ncbi:hypothetical protein [Pedobacter montanisoli]|uniref:Lipoprotein n=1 Tax=Pedobacter montanisoli TaxID=2923277 RepID=A0ABS9ZTX5_9SPHI|nr:hypothetical protein [Pedobacter montanisoli]MCJ0741369.1 hypothetical protein [Pedobacter montanisoli]
MKRLTYFLWFGLLFLACSKSDTRLNVDTEIEKPCGTHTSGQKLFLGPQGGCFYFNSNGNKTYVDRKECKC